jgi:sulfate/thiosulfate transport system permease protein
VPSAERRGAWTAGHVALLAAVLGYLALVLLVPLAALVAKTLGTGVGAVWRGLTDPDALAGLRQSLVLAAAAVVANGVFGVAAALVLARDRFRGRALLDALADLPLAISPVMTGLAFLLVFGRGGWLHPLLEPLGVRVVFAFPGLLLATLFVTLPFTLREVGYALEELGTEEEQCAATLGASAWQTFWLVTLPNVRGSLVLGITLTTARALGEFGAVLVIGGAISGETQTATTFIYAATEERREAAAYGMALLLAVVSTVLLLILQRTRRRAPADDRHSAPGD